MKYPNLKYYNDWEHHSYKAGKAEIKTLLEVMVGKETHKVFFHHDVRHYSDHGHQETVTSKRYFIKVKVLGASMPQYLDVLLDKGLKIKVVAWKGK